MAQWLNLKMAQWGCGVMGTVVVDFPARPAEGQEVVGAIVKAAPEAYFRKFRSSLTFIKTSSAMNKNLLLLCAILSLGACKKSDSASFPYSGEYIIKGMFMYDFDARAMGLVGNPDDILKADSTLVALFPNPARTLLNFVVRSPDIRNTTFTYRIVPVSYPDAPDSINLYQGTSYEEKQPVVVENKLQVGQEVFRGDVAFTVDRNAQSAGIRVDVENYPKGFYRLFVQTNTGIKLRVAFYKY